VVYILGLGSSLLRFFRPSTDDDTAYRRLVRTFSLVSDALLHSTLACWQRQEIMAALFSVITFRWRIKRVSGYWTATAWHTRTSRSLFPDGMLWV
jgi:hypothetical protein